jgi:hypothetical protein
MNVLVRKDEKRFLEGPQSRWNEFKFTVKIFFQFIRGFRTFHFLGPCVTVFGSARFKSDHPFYIAAEKISGKISQMGFTIMTGGGPGIMEAANKGAKEAGGKSVGCNIFLEHEQNPNPYLDKWVTLDYFFVRKVFLSKYSYAFIVMPGGYGTLDEFFEALTLIQTGKISKFPIVLFCKEFHEKLYHHLQYLKEHKLISESDLELFLFTDSINEACDFIEKNAVDKFSLERIPKPIKWFGEGR